MRGAIRRQAARPTLRRSRTIEQMMNYIVRAAKDPFTRSRAWSELRTRALHPSIGEALADAIARNTTETAPRWTLQLHHDNLLATPAPETPCLGTHPQLSDSRPLRGKSRACCARANAATASKATASRSLRARPVRTRLLTCTWPLAPGLSPRLASRTHSVGTMANTSVARHSRRSTRASVAISSGISTRPPRPSCTACRRPFRNVRCHAPFSPDNASRRLHRRNGRGPRAPPSASHASRRCRIHPSKTENRNQFWGQIEGRLLPMLEGEPALTLDLLNTATQAWVEQEYQRKVHSEIRESPLDRPSARPRGHRRH